MKRTVLAPTLLAALAACIPPAPVAPAPLVVQTGRPATDVVRTVAALLTADGFEIINSDAAAGILTAKRTAKRPAFAGAVICRWANGSISDNWGQIALTVSVTSRGDSAQVTSRAHVTFDGIPRVLDTGPSDTDCVSSGSTEAKIHDLFARKETPK
jgi:hypothetical protein